MRLGSCLREPDPHSCLGSHSVSIGRNLSRLRLCTADPLDKTVTIQEMPPADLSKSEKTPFVGGLIPLFGTSCANQSEGYVRGRTLTGILRTVIQKHFAAVEKWEAQRHTVVIALPHQRVICCQPLIQDRVGSATAKSIVTPSPLAPIISTVNVVGSSGA